MKREIKFRAWDGLEMIRMATDESLDSFFLHIQIKADIFDKKCELMQFTGLKDKNGKEIYEGDILRTINHFDIDNNPVYLHHKVVYDAERAVFNAINLNNGNDLLTTNGNCFLYVALKSVLIEVVGNIYETPELLK